MLPRPASVWRRCARFDAFAGRTADAARAAAQLSVSAAGIASDRSRPLHPRCVAIADELRSLRGWGTVMPWLGETPCPYWT